MLCASQPVGDFRQRLLRDRRDLAFQPRHERVELIDDGPNGFGLAQIDAGALQQRHRMIAAARLQQRQIAVDGGGRSAAEPPVSCFISCALDAKQVAY